MKKIVRVKPKTFFDKTFTAPVQENFDYSINDENYWPIKWNCLFGEVVTLNQFGSILDCPNKNLIGDAKMIDTCYDVLDPDKDPEYFL